MYPKRTRGANTNLWSKLIAKGDVLRESHIPPGEAVRLLTKLGGLNRFGEAKYRAVWSNDRLSWVAGKFEDRNAAGELIREVLAARYMQKYPVFNRWIIEQWLAPEAYGTPETWWRSTREWGEEGNLPQLGPYPSRGDFEIACVMESHPSSGQKFVQLTSTLIEEFFWLMNQAKMHRYRESVQRRKELAAKEKKDFVKYSHEYLNEATMPVANDGMMVTVL
jgi:hypothetical protein